MNSGCYNNDISKILTSINVIDVKNCIEKEIKKEDIKFFYRGTNLPEGLIITSVKLKGKMMSRDEIEKKQNDYIERKKKSQTIQIKNCGSTFKNISEDRKAWQLIKETGCDKFKEEAMMSKTAIFVNNGKTKSSDIEKLIDKVRKTVNTKTGIKLELEIKIIGE